MENLNSFEANKIVSTISKSRGVEEPVHKKRKVVEGGNDSISSSVSIELENSSSSVSRNRQSPSRNSKALVNRRPRGPLLQLSDQESVRVAGSAGSTAKIKATGVTGSSIAEDKENNPGPFFDSVRALFMKIHSIPHTVDSESSRGDKQKRVISNDEYITIDQLLNADKNIFDTP